MARLIFGVVLFTMVFAQATILPEINPFVVSPDIVLLMLFAASMYMGLREGLLWLFVAGIITDVLAMDPLGANGIALLPAVLLVGPARQSPVWRRPHGTLADVESPPVRRSPRRSRGRVNPPHAAHDGRCDRPRGRHQGARYSDPWRD